MTPEMPEGVKAVVDAASDAKYAAPPEETKTIQKDKPKKPSAIQLKRQQIFMDRLKRKLNEKNEDGSAKTQAQAIQEIQREDYERMPVDKKLQRLEMMFSAVIQQMTKDLAELRHNDGVIADAYDVNYRAMEKMFDKLGIKDEERKNIMQQAHLEAQADKQAELQARMKADKERQEQLEKLRMEAEAAKDGKPQMAEEKEPEVDPHVEQGATEFGS